MTTAIETGRAASVTAHTVKSLASVRARDWDALATCGDAPLSHGFLSAWENVELRGLRSRPVVAFAPGREQPVAACPGYFYDLDVPTVRSPKTSPVVHAIRRVIPGFLYARTYELGSPTPLTNPFMVRDPELRATAVPAMIEAALATGEKDDADFVLVQNFTSRSGPAADELSGLGFAGVPILATAVVDVKVDSFDDYLSSMRSQYRRRARQTLKRSQKLSPEHLSEFGHLAGELARLWGLIYERASEVKREILTPAFFQAASELDECSVLLMRRDDGSIASFGLLMRDGPWLAFLQCGFELEAAHDEAAYFRLLYEIVRLGIERGCKQVDLGITTLEPKLDVGAVPVPLFAWVKHRNPIFQRGILALARGPLRPPKLEPRSVFKEPPRPPSELVADRLLPM